VSVNEEEIMGLYAIAREELDGVTAATKKLEGIIHRLEVTDSHIMTCAKRGIDESIFDYKSKVGV
jgi:hypothetical protein